MIRLFNLLIITILFHSCSFNENSKFWSNSKELVLEENIKFQEIFPKEESLKKEFNSGLNLKFTSKTTNNTNLNNLLNNDGRLNFDGRLKKNLVINFQK